MMPQTATFGRPIPACTFISRTTWEGLTSRYPCKARLPGSFFHDRAGIAEVEAADFVRANAASSWPMKRLIPAVAPVRVAAPQSPRSARRAKGRSSL